MPQVIGIILAIVIGLWLAVMIVWSLFVLVARIIAYVLGLAIIVAGLALLAGIITGLVIPYRVLRGANETGPTIATPAKVRAGGVFRLSASGAAKNFGWDYAWPNYVPFQFHHDQTAVLRQSGEVSTGALGLCLGWWFPLAFIPALGFTVGLWIGTLLWYLITWAFRVFVVITQSITLRILRAQETHFMKQEGATVHCVQPGCYGVTDTPSFRCSNPACRVIHRDMTPGRLGIRTRVCGCGQELPLTVARASPVLEAICPYCDSSLPRGSGTRRVIQIPVLGPVAAGKTQFLAASATSLNDHGDDVALGLTITPLSSVAEQFLTTSVNESRAGRAPAKTVHDDKPEGYPFLVEGPESTFEMHLLDAAGENFVTAEHAHSLTYLNDATAYVFLVDPLAIPVVADSLHRSRMNGQIPVAQGSTEDAYGSVVDQLDDLDRRRIAVVVTKVDVVAEISETEQKIPIDSAGIRTWLQDVGEDRLIARIESDFANVTYFAVDSTSRGRPNIPPHPLGVVDWAIRAQGGQSLFGEPTSSAARGSAKGEEASA